MIPAFGARLDWLAAPPIPRECRPTLRPAKPFAKHCGCGETYDYATWRTLRYVGRMDDGEGGWLELRDCEACRSTLGIEVQR